MKKICISFLLLFLAGCKNDRSVFNGYIEGSYRYISPTSSGVLQRLNVRRGDKIKAGQVLFSLNDIPLKTAIENAKSEICKAESALKEAEAEYMRAQYLVKNNTISKSSFNQREDVYNSSKAQLDIAKQGLLLAQKNLDDASPRAADDCFVDDTFLLSGEFVAAGKPVVSLLSPKDVKVRFFVPQSVLPNIKLDQQVLISCDGSDNKMHAKITHIAKKAEYAPPVIYSTESRHKMVFMVEAKFKQQPAVSNKDNDKNFIHPGLPVTIEIRPLAKPAYNEEMQGAYVAQNRNVHGVHEDSSNGGTKQLPLEVGLCKGSNDGGIKNG